ncbi:hypothetical protein DFH07DRAFT_844805 [Mycena maculata]|uniref:Uncharacterized protein n=1 Tax=Mycena maculata TaxID=230809 RepID=A0AAD7I3R6_9AGAR|nr:hypothetical protein DFH07DRAFT_844805 [Mycena maculata]
MPSLPQPPEKTSLNKRPKMSATESRRRHALAQARYWERNLESTRKQSQLGMVKLREKRSTRKGGTQLARLERREMDADYRERVRQRNFVNKFGLSPYYNYYLPTLKRLGIAHLPGVSWAWENEEMKKVLPNPAQLEKVKNLLTDALAVRGGGK